MAGVRARKSAELTETLTFRLGALGSRVADRFVAAVARYDVKPKHVGLLVAIDASGPASQLELARVLRVAPSLVVQLADHLVALGAIERSRDAKDRRRQYLLLTAAGRRLLTACGEAARQVDEELAAGLSAGQLDELRGLLGVLATREGLPVEPA
jgi:DNA-binding MarR family transcriptional regulator